MNTSQNSVIWWIVGVIAILLCCCCLFIFGVAGLAVGLSTTSISQSQPPAVATVAVEPLPTGEDEESRPAGPTATPQTPADPHGLNPDLSEPVPAGALVTEQELANAVVPARDLRALGEQLRGTGPIPEVVRTVAKPYRVGDQETFWVSDGDSSEHMQIQAELVYTNDVLYIWVEDSLDYDLDDIRRAADRFATETYPTNRNFFGSEWSPGVDGDLKLHILHSDKLGENIAGYFSGADEVSRMAQPYSNEREMFYIHLGNTSPNSEFYNGVLAHEFQHMIHWYQDKNETSWVNEGMSELATELNGYSRGGADQVFSQLPDTQLTTWSDNPDGRAQHYGGAYLFMSYFLQRFGNELTQAVVASKANGAEGFDEVLEAQGTGLTFDDVFADWVIANYLDDPTLADGRYGYERDDPASMAIDARHRRYPVQRETEVSQYGTDYIELLGRGDLQISFQGATTAQLAAHDAHSGQFSWWGNREDDSDARLTREFDLSGLDKATLNFWTWYDIEDDYDYGYVLVSTDGGKTWETLRTEAMTDENPNGNSFGWAFTGCSGDPESDEAGEACTAQWIEQSADLTPYAGQQVQLRFEYITDDAMNYPGFFVDDISIPELGYSDDAESEDGGWLSEGWIRTDNLLRQRWLVQLIQHNGADAPLVTRLPVDESGTGTWTINDLDRNGKVILAISALAPVTSEKALYEYTVTQP